MIKKSTNTSGNDNFFITPTSDENKEQSSFKFNLSKVEDDLYHEDEDIAEPIIRVKRVTMPNKNEKWKIFQDNKLQFTIEGHKLNSKERDFLRTVDGFNFLIKKYKEGIKSFNALKQEIKKNIKSPA
jgi:hypothetical protein